jgi:general secretion pathway protein L
MPVAVIPDTLLLPWQEGDWSILPDGQRIVVRTGCWTGFVTEPETLNWFLNQALVEAGEAKPQRLRIWGSPPPSMLDRAWQIENESPEPLQRFAAGYRPEAALNLLQGPYSQQTPWKRRLRPWRTAAILAGVWLIVQGFGQVYEHGRLQQEQITLRAEIEQVYKDAMPGATRIVNPRVQLETRLRELAPTIAGDSGFLELLHQGGQALVNFPDIILHGLSYREGQLDLALEGGNPTVLDQLRQQFEQRPDIRAEMRTTQREGRMESKVTLKKAAS